MYALIYKYIMIYTYTHTPWQLFYDSCIYQTKYVMAEKLVCTKELQTMNVFFLNFKHAMRRTIEEKCNF